MSLVAVGALAVIGGGFAYAMNTDTAPSYRTAVAAMGAVDQLTTSAGTVAYVQKATAAFPAAGTVSAVAVAVGQEVTAGQSLATLDRTALDADVANAKQTLALDQQTLASDLASQTQTTTTATTAAPTPAASTASPTTANGNAASGDAASGGTTSGSDTSGNTGRVSGAGAGETGSGSDDGGSAAGRSGAGSTSGATTGGSPVPTSGVGGTTGAGPTTALAAAVSAAQQKVITGERTIDRLLTGMAAATGSTGTGIATGSGTGRSGTPPTGSRSSGRPSTVATTTAPPTTTTESPVLPAVSSQAALIKDEITACTPISTSPGGPSSPAGSRTHTPTSGTSTAAPTVGTTRSTAPPTRPSGSGSPRADGAAFTVLAPTLLGSGTQAAIDDVVAGRGNAIVAAGVAYQALSADDTASSTPADPTASSTIATGTTGTTSTTSTPTPTTSTPTTSTDSSAGGGTSSGPTSTGATSSPGESTDSSTTSAAPVTTTATVTATVGTTVTATVGTTVTVRAPRSAQALAQCQAAIAAVLDNQTQVAAAEQSQSTNLTALDTAIKEWAAARQGGSGTTGTAAPTTSRGDAGAGGSSGTGTGSSTRTGSGSGSGSGTGTGGSGSSSGSASGTGTATTRPGTATGNSTGSTGGGTGSTGGDNTSGSGGNIGAGNGGAGNTGAGNGGANGGNGGAAAGKVATAADISADQAQIDLDQATIAVATQNLSAATLTSPIAGIVAAVGVTKGQTVAANATGSAITILGPGQYEVTTTIALSLIDQLAIGDGTSVAVNGITTPLPGKVTAIGVLSSAATSGSVTYPVTILLDATSQTLYEGSGASVIITLHRVDGVLTVPTSAVHTTGGQHSVSVLANGAQTSVRVEVGAVGTALTQITSGLTAGQAVVLADLSQPLTSSTTSAAAGLSNLGGNGNTARIPGAGGGFNRSGG